jgi:hypothetical protein
VPVQTFGTGSNAGAAVRGRSKNAYPMLITRKLAIVEFVLS